MPEYPIFDIEIIRPNKKGQHVATQTNRLVKITHNESGISATGHSTKSELEARCDAEDKILPLIKIWQNSCT